MRLEQVRVEALSILGIGRQFRYNSRDVGMICRRLRLGYDKMCPDRHQLDLDLAEKVEAAWQERRHGIE